MNTLMLIPAFFIVRRACLAVAMMLYDAAARRDEAWRR